MKRPRLLLAIAAVLFFGWVTFLAYLAVGHYRNPVVLSRPQVLVCNLVVIGQVDGPETPSVKVLEVPYAVPADAAPARDSVLEVDNLKDCAGWAGAGRYILPLSLGPGGKKYAVTAIPRSPDYPGGPPRIYPATAETEAQLRQILERQKTEGSRQ
jgi:hypothetical protein